MLGLPVVIVLSRNPRSCAAPGFDVYTVRPIRSDPVPSRHRPFCSPVGKFCALVLAPRVNAPNAVAPEAEIWYSTESGSGAPPSLVTPARASIAATLAATAAQRISGRFARML